VLIPLGVGLKHWFTKGTVAECRREIKARSSFIGMQAYEPSGGDSPSRLIVRFRAWWLLHQEAELLVDLESDVANAAYTAVRVKAGLRVGTALVLLVWGAAMLVPLLAFSSMPTKVFFAVMLLLPVISVLITAPLQIRSALRRLRIALPPASSDADHSALGGGATVR
jgi:hypothetical protein